MSAGEEPSAPGGERDAEQLLAEQIATSAGYVAFGSLTVAQVEERAEELSGAAEIPAMAQRMAPVAAAWRGLAADMRRSGAETVADLDRASLVERAERLWVVPPGGSLL